MAPSLTPNGVKKMEIIMKPKRGCKRDAGRERILLLLEVDKSERCRSQIIAAYPKIRTSLISIFVLKNIINTLNNNNTPAMIRSERKERSIALRRYNFPPRDSAKGTEIRADK